MERSRCGLLVAAMATHSWTDITGATGVDCQPPAMQIYCKVIIFFWKIASRKDVDHLCKISEVFYFFLQTSKT